MKTLERYCTLLLKTKVTKEKIKLGQELLLYLQSCGSAECQDAGAVVEGILLFIQSSNFELSLVGLDVMNELLRRMEHTFLQYVPSALPSVIKRLGGKEPAREKCHLFLTRLVEMGVITPQQLIAHLVPAFSDISGDVKYEALKCLVATLNQYGANYIELSHFVPSVVEFLSDSNCEIKNRALDALTEVYRHFGDGLRSELAKNLPPSEIVTVMEKLDEIKLANEFSLTAKSSVESESNIEEFQVSDASTVNSCTTFSKVPSDEPTVLLDIRAADKRNSGLSWSENSGDSSTLQSRGRRSRALYKSVVKSFKLTGPLRKKSNRDISVHISLNSDSSTDGLTRSNMEMTLAQNAAEPIFKSRSKKRRSIEFPCGDDSSVVSDQTSNEGTRMIDADRTKNFVNFFKKKKSNAKNMDFSLQLDQSTDCSTALERVSPTKVLSTENNPEPERFREAVTKSGNATFIVDEDGNKSMDLSLDVSCTNTRPLNLLSEKAGVVEENQNSENTNTGSDSPAVVNNIQLSSGVVATLESSQVVKSASRLSAAEVGSSPQTVCEKSSKPPVKGLKTVNGNTYTEVITVAETVAEQAIHTDVKPQAPRASTRKCSTFCESSPEVLTSSAGSSEPSDGLQAEGNELAQMQMRLIPCGDESSVVSDQTSYEGTRMIDADRTKNYVNVFKKKKSSAKNVDLSLHLDESTDCSIALEGVSPTKVSSTEPERFQEAGTKSGNATSIVIDVSCNNARPLNLLYEKAGVVPVEEIQNSENAKTGSSPAVVNEVKLTPGVVATSESNQFVKSNMEMTLSRNAAEPIFKSRSKKRRSIVFPCGDDSSVVSDQTSNEGTRIIDADQTKNYVNCFKKKKSSAKNVDLSLHLDESTDCSIALERVSPTKVSSTENNPEPERFREAGGMKSGNATSIVEEIGNKRTSVPQGVSCNNARPLNLLSEKAGVVSVEENKNSENTNTCNDTLAVVNNIQLSSGVVATSESSQVVKSNRSNMEVTLAQNAAEPIFKSTSRKRRSIKFPCEDDSSVVSVQTSNEGTRMIDADRTKNYVNVFTKKKSSAKNVDLSLHLNGSTDCSNASEQVSSTRGHCTENIPESVSFQKAHPEHPDATYTVDGISHESVALSLDASCTDTEPTDVSSKKVEFGESRDNEEASGLDNADTNPQAEPREPRTDGLKVDNPRIESILSSGNCSDPCSKNINASTDSTGSGTLHLYLPTDEVGSVEKSRFDESPAHCNPSTTAEIAAPVQKAACGTSDSGGVEVLPPQQVPQLPEGENKRDSIAVVVSVKESQNSETTNNGSNSPAVVNEIQLSSGVVATSESSQVVKSASRLSTAKIGSSPQTVCVKSSKSPEKDLKPVNGNACTEVMTVAETVPEEVIHTHAPKPQAPRASTRKFVTFCESSPEVLTYSARSSEPSDGLQAEGNELVRMQMTTDLSAINGAQLARPGSYQSSTPVPKKKMPAQEPHAFLVPCVPAPHSSQNPQLSSDNGSSETINSDCTLNISAIPKDVNMPKSSKLFTSTPKPLTRKAAQKKSKVEKSGGEKAGKAVNHSVQTSRVLRSSSRSASGQESSESRSSRAITDLTNLSANDESKRKDRNGLAKSPSSSQLEKSENVEPNVSPVEPVPIADETMLSAQVASVSRAATSSRNFRTATSKGSLASSYASHVDRRSASKRLFTPTSSGSTGHLKTVDSMAVGGPSRNLVDLSDDVDDVRQFPPVDEEDNLPYAPNDSLQGVSAGEPDKSASWRQESAQMSSRSSTCSSSSTESSFDCDNAVAWYRKHGTDVKARNRNATFEAFNVPELRKMKKIRQYDSELESWMRKKRKMYKPAKWVTKELYNYLEKLLEPNYGLDKRLKAEEVILDMVDSYNRVQIGHVDGALDQLKAKMRELEICNMYITFYAFIRKFMPYDYLRHVLQIPSKLYTYDPEAPRRSCYDLI